MNGSSKLTVSCIAVLVAVGAVAAAPALGSEGGASASSYEFTSNTREDLIARRSAFDPSDGLQRWEGLLLAMDPNGAVNVGR